MNYVEGDKEHCDLCEARALGVHPWELLWRIDSIPSDLLRQDPDYPKITKPIYHYEGIARSLGWKGMG